jgi:hypothetical protein
VFGDTGAKALVEPVIVAAVDRLEQIAHLVRKRGKKR